MDEPPQRFIALMRWVYLTSLYEEARLYITNSDGFTAGELCL